VSAADLFDDARRITVIPIAMRDPKFELRTHPRATKANNDDPGMDESAFPHNSAYNPTGRIAARAYRVAVAMRNRYVENPGIPV
jgi:hypothetical protein